MPLLLPIILLLAASLVCSNPDDPPYIDVPNDQDGAATVFIWAVGNGDGQLAMSKLSTEAKVAVVEHCGSGQVLACFNQVGLQDWGTIKLEHIVLKPSYSNESSAVYQTTWSSGAVIWVVLEIVNEDGEWRVNSWRGWIQDEAVPHELIDGTDTSNSFPPVE